MSLHATYTWTTTCIFVSSSSLQWMLSLSVEHDLNWGYIQHSEKTTHFSRKKCPSSTGTVYIYINFHTCTHVNIVFITSWCPPGYLIFATPPSRFRFPSPPSGQVRRLERDQSNHLFHKYTSKMLVVYRGLDHDQHSHRIFFHYASRILTVANHVSQGSRNIFFC